MSKAFTFTLEAALRQRVHQEQEIQIALARLVTGHGEALAHLDHLDGMRAQARQAAETGTALDPEARMNALYYLDRCAHVAEQQRGIVAQWEQEVQRVRALLVDASRRRRGLEKLRERRRQEFEAETQRRAALQLDELVTMRHARMARQPDPYAAPEAADWELGHLAGPRYANDGDRLEAVAHSGTTGDRLEAGAPRHSRQMTASPKNEPGEGASTDAAYQ